MRLAGHKPRILGERWLLAGVVLAAVAVRLPLALQTTYLWPDGIEYLNIAEHIASGQGFTLSIRAYYVDTSPVVTSGLSVRPVLYPLVLAPLAALPGWPRSTQLLNVILSAGAAALVYLLGRRFASRAAAFTAALLAALAVPTVAFSMRPMSEPLALFLSLLAFVLITRRTGAGAVGAGVVLGLAYLTRPPSALFLLPVALSVLLEGGPRAPRIRRLLLLVIGGAATGGTVALWSLFTTGQVYLGPTFNYSVPRYGLAQRGAFQAGPPPGALTYVSEHLDDVLSAITGKLGEYSRALLSSPLWTPVMLPGLPLTLVAIARGRLLRGALPLLLAAALHFGITVVTWANFFDPRYLLPVYVFFLPVAMVAWTALPGFNRPLTRLAGVRLSHLVFGATLLVSLGLTLRDPQAGLNRGPLLGEVWVGSPRAWNNPGIGQLIAWVAENTSPQSIVSDEYPWVLTFFTNRPSALLPAGLTDAELERFVRELRVDYLIVDRNDRDRRDYIGALEDLSKSHGVVQTQIGSFHVFATSGVR